MWERENDHQLQHSISKYYDGSKYSSYTESSDSSCSGDGVEYIKEEVLNEVNTEMGLDSEIIIYSADCAREVERWESANSTLLSYW